MRDGRGYVVAFGAGVVATLLVAAADPYAGLDLFARALSDVDQSYDTPVDLTTLVYAALHGVPAVLDDHSQFFTPAEWDTIQRRDAGLSLGIGAALVAEPCGLRITAIEAWGPAEGQALAVGDCVVGIDGGGPPGNPEVLQGMVGSAVRVKVSHEGKEREVAILRALAHEPTIRSEALPHGVLYVRIADFAGVVAAPLSRQLHDARALVLDLRQNPGGRVEEAAAVLDLFLSGGTLVTTRTRAGGETTLVATPSRSDSGVPIVVLVDDQTASAAELAAGVLQETGRARLVGTTTYGKGSVQRVFKYDDGSALKLTVGHYFLPSGRTLSRGHGLVPDLQVAAATPDFHASAASRSTTDAPLAAALTLLAPKP